MEPLHDNQPLAAARFIKEIGRGKDGARSLTRADADLMYTAMLEGRVSDLELGAILLAMRIKGESIDELAGFLDAAERSFPLLEAPGGDYAPIVIPSYNGSRNMPNLTPLLALLLARAGAPVLVHGMLHDPKRVTTAEIFHELGLPPAGTPQAAQAEFARGLPAFMPIDMLAPKLAHQLSLRRILGVRSSTHTLVKIMQPFVQPALRLTSYTHPEYLELLTAYFTTAAPAERGDAFLMRGTEGETVANARRAQQIEWFHEGQRTVLVQKQGPVDELPPLPPTNDAQVTAAWIKEALDGAQPIPQPIIEQVEHCLLVSKQIRARQSHHEKDITPPS
ncbi:anthranilate phosphoribosyltransferase [Paucimonas lemoignei]|uniref:Anthranilate phosphoribosyltransferase n=1 Tax=Paucimonas lemoignei TaxID=29443 RepID=A0A4R3I197_PAULE|nr:DNA-binding protein YbiB [Paucimonas lemoignei]TCS38365.1 anthranilate phosphoribosyltransferase [Paucimonas lemoignei]